MFQLRSINFSSKQCVPQSIGAFRMGVGPLLFKLKNLVVLFEVVV
jgi:hypothetical protein